MSPQPLKHGDKVTINSPAHRMNGRTGTVTSRAPGLFLGTWKVEVNGAEYAMLPTELRPATNSEASAANHYANYLRYKALVDAEPKPFTASQQRTPLQYLPYAHYPTTP